MLTWQDDDTGLALSVRFDRWDALQNTRARWHWSISAAGETLASADDLTTVGDPHEAEALETLASFLGAWDESWRYAPDGTGENCNLFPAALRDLGAGVDWEDVAYRVRETLGALIDR